MYAAPSSSSSASRSAVMGAKQGEEENSIAAGGSNVRRVKGESKGEDKRMDGERDAVPVESNRDGDDRKFSDDEVRRPRK